MLYYHQILDLIADVKAVFKRPVIFDQEHQIR